MNLLELDPDVLLGTVQVCMVHHIDYKLPQDCEECVKEYCTHCRNKPVSAHFGSHILSCFAMYIPGWSPNSNDQVKYTIIRAIKHYTNKDDMPDFENFKQSQSKKSLWEWCVKMSLNFMMDDEREKFIHAELEMSLITA